MRSMLFAVAGRCRPVADQLLQARAFQMDAQDAAHRREEKLTPMPGRERRRRRARTNGARMAPLTLHPERNTRWLWGMSRTSDIRTGARRRRGFSASISVSPDAAFANPRFEA